MHADLQRLRLVRRIISAHGQSRAPAPQSSKEPAAAERATTGSKLIMDVTSPATSRPQDACVSDSNATALDATGLAQLGAGGNAIAHHEEVEALLAVLLVEGGDEHAAGVDTHHLARGQVGDCDERLAHQLLGLVIPVNAGEDHAVSTRAVIEHEA